MIGRVPVEKMPLHVLLEVLPEDSPLRTALAREEVYAPLGDEFLVNTTTPGDQERPDLVQLANGTVVAVWKDNSGVGGDASDFGIKAQLLDASGNKIGPEFLVNTVTNELQQTPVVAALSSGGFVVVWHDFSDLANTGSNIKAQLFDQTGTPVGGEFMINSTLPSGQSAPTIAALAGGGFVVSWMDSLGAGEGSSSSIRAQVFDNLGNKVGSEFLVNTTTHDFQSFPEVAALDSGGFVVAWTDQSGLGGDNSGLSVKFQRFDALGNKVGIETLANTETANDQFLEGVTGLPSGGFVISWTDFNPAADGSGSAAKAQIFDSLGNKVGAELLVNTSVNGDQSATAVVALANGDFVVTFSDASNFSLNGWDAKGQIFTSTGAPFGGEFLLSSVVQGNQLHTSVAAVSTGFIAGWTDTSGLGGDASGGAIKARLFDKQFESETVASSLNSLGYWGASADLLGI